MMAAKTFESWDLFVALVSSELGIELTDQNQDLLGEFPDPSRLQEFCRFYLTHTHLYPIWRASSLDQILGSLSMKFETGEVTDTDLLLVKEIVCDASTNPWAASFLLSKPNDYNPEVDPGDFKVSQWLLNHSGLDMNQIQAQMDRFKDPTDYLE